MTALFDAKVRTFGPRFMRDLSLRDFHVGGLFGNFGTETGGFQHKQEISPVVKGSKGGYGWNQATGPRRRQFEAFIKQQGYDVSTEAGYDEACYAFIVHELRGSESAALAALKRTTTLEAATKAVCDKYERPGVPHLDSRMSWARKAMAALAGAPVAATDAEPVVNYNLWKRGVAYAELKEVQTLLQGAGYYLQGEVDGKWGVLTRDSLLAFKAGKNLSRTDVIDEATMIALRNAKPRELPPERSQATVEQVAPKSEIIPAAQGVQTDAKKGGFLQMIGGAFAMLFGGGTATKLVNEDPGSVQQTAENARWLREYFPDLPISFWLFLAVAIVFVWPHAVAWWSARKASKIVDLKVEEYRTGGRA